MDFDYHSALADRELKRSNNEFYQGMERVGISSCQTQPNLPLGIYFTEGKKYESKVLEVIYKQPYMRVGCRSRFVAPKGVKNKGTS